MLVAGINPIQKKAIRLLNRKQTVWKPAPATPGELKKLKPKKGPMQTINPKGPKGSKADKPKDGKGRLSDVMAERISKFSKCLK